MGRPILVFRPTNRERQEMYYAYVILYYVVLFKVPSHKLYKGIIWRNVLKVPPMRYVGRRWTKPLALAVRDGARSIVALVVWDTIVWYAIPASHGLHETLFWTPPIAAFMADYLHDDDRFKRFYNEVRNKIRWKMELPVPVPNRGGGTA